MSSRKSKHRFFVPPPQIKNGKVCIRGTDVWHITKVLRLSQGQKVIVFDGSGREYLVALDKPKRQEVFGFVLEQWEQPSESPLKLSLVQAVPKSDKMDLIVQKATEIGVNEIIPLSTTRSIWGTKPKHNQDAKVYQRLERWSRIGIEAAKQSCRTSVPLIRPLLSIEEFLSHPLETDLQLLLWEEEQQMTLKDTLRNQAGSVRSASIVIGPEGGFTADESELFQQHDYLPVSLGKRILRTETAGPVVLGILQYEFGDY
ncbi:MAG: 16S rRNA (uracil(1498)-N(3))-methyltransferase [bacterium]|nr:16S rRNA (uracil(1498)-N(3))-methyltransferase [bacterium]